MGIRAYLKDVISSSDTSSSRKFVTLLITLHFIVSSFVILFFAFYVIVWMPKGKVDVELLNSLKEVLRYDFYIILSGLGFVTSSDLVRVIISKGFNPNPVTIQNTTDGDNINTGTTKEESESTDATTDSKTKTTYD